MLGWFHKDSKIEGWFDPSLQSDLTWFDPEQYEEAAGCTPLDIQVAADVDDAAEDEGSSTVVTAEGAPHNIGTGDTAETPDRHFAWRWTVPSLHQGATITSATLRLVHDGGGWNQLDFTVYGEDQDDPVALSGGSILSARTRTTANTVVSDNINEADLAERDIDVTAIVQEIVNRGGWAPGQHIVLIAAGEGGSSFAAKVFHNYATNPALAARLLIEYTGCGGGGGFQAAWALGANVVLAIRRLLS